MRAMILAAGRGKRMRPLTDTTPKPLLRVAGKPLIVWHIERLVAGGIPDIIINHAWLGQQIETSLGDGRQFGARLHYSPEPVALETAGGIARALPFFGKQPFLVINGDIWCDWDPVLAGNSAKALHSQKALAWLLMVDNPQHNPDGDFGLAAPLDAPALAASSIPIHKTCETPTPTPFSGVHLRDDKQRIGLAQPLTFAGIGIYHPDLFLDVPSGAPAALAPVLRAAIEKDRVIGSRHTGEWVDVGTPERLQALDRRLAMQGQARYTSN